MYVCHGVTLGRHVLPELPRKKVARSLMSKEVRKGKRRRTKMNEIAEHFREIVEGLDFTLQSILCTGLLL